MTKIEELAYNLLNSKDNNGYGIKCEAVSKVCEENNVKFRELWLEVVKQGNEKEGQYAENIG